MRILGLGGSIHYKNDTPFNCNTNKDSFLQKIDYRTSKKRSAIGLNAFCILGDIPFFVLCQLSFKFELKK